MAKGSLAEVKKKTLIAAQKIVAGRRPVTHVVVWALLPVDSCSGRQLIGRGRPGLRSGPIG